jgi:hypothetical protein
MEVRAEVCKAGVKACAALVGQALFAEAKVPPKSLLAVLATLAPLPEDFPTIRDLPPDPVDL